MCGKGYLLCEQHNYRDSNSRTYRVMCCYRVVCSSQINICCTAGAAGDSLADHTNSTSANPFTSLFPLHPPHRATRAPPGPPPSNIWSTYSPQNYQLMAPDNTRRPKRTARPPSTPAPPLTGTPILTLTQPKRGVLYPPPRAKLWPPTGEWSVHIGPAGTIGEHMAQLVEQASQTRPR